jgi:hypothetical protein
MEIENVSSQYFTFVFFYLFIFCLFVVFLNENTELFLISRPSNDLGENILEMEWGLTCNEVHVPHVPDTTGCYGYSNHDPLMTNQIAVSNIRRG